METSNTNTTLSDVQEYYGKTLSASCDLKTNACTTSKRKLTPFLKETLGMIHDEVIMKYYGCGLVFPEAVENCRVVDLGSGSGRDCYILSRLVGEGGYITGVDMTKEQLDVSRRYVDYHTQLFGYKQPNVKFLEGYIEDLESCGIAPSSTDIIVSNCVINLSVDKQKTLEQAYKILKEGGEMYFSDVYADKTIPDQVRADKVLYGECLSGALSWNELMTLSTQVGFAPPILVDVSPIVTNKPELQAILGDLKFCSATYRLFKISRDESNPSSTLIEVKYKGTITDHPDEFKFASNIIISKCRPVVLPASVAQLLMDSRLALHFVFTPKASSSSTAVCSDLSDFISVNPFTVMEEAPAASTGGCC